MFINLPKRKYYFSGEVGLFYFFFICVCFALYIRWVEKRIEVSGWRFPIFSVEKEKQGSPPEGSPSLPDLISPISDNFPPLLTTGDHICPLDLPTRDTFFFLVDPQSTLTSWSLGTKIDRLLLINGEFFWHNALMRHRKKFNLLWPSMNYFRQIW